MPEEESRTTVVELMKSPLTGSTEHICNWDLGVLGVRRLATNITVYSISWYANEKLLVWSLSVTKSWKLEQYLIYPGNWRFLFWKSSSCIFT